MDATRRAVEAVVRQSYGRLVAFLSSRSGDIAAAEDALGDALAIALERWPESGVPPNPDAWLLTAARRKLLDAAKSGDGRTARGIDFSTVASEPEAEGPEIPDDRLRLLFACAHPALDPSLHSPLMLQTVLGLDAATIARAILVPAATMAQRLVRAKGKLRDAKARFDVPAVEHLTDRSAPVLEAIYTAFGTGWDTPGATPGRVDGLAEEAIWLGRVLVSVMPDEPEAAGLLALMTHSHARRDARRTATGEYVPLTDQDVSAWRADEIDEADRVLTAAARAGRFGRFQLEAAIQSAHNARRRFGRVEWPTIAQLYEGLVRVEPSAGALVGRAAAVAEAFGPEAGLGSLDAVEEALRPNYQPYWALLAHLHARNGDPATARSAYNRAIGLTSDSAVRTFLTARRDALPQGP